MEHMAWKGRIKPGCKAEYQKRHAEIWPEMVKVLKDAGICNYSIFYCNDELFGYYECEKGVAYAEKVQAESPVVFPEGVGVCPWMVPGGADIAMATSELMKTYQAAIWAQHGLFASGPDFDITFGLAHTIEKSAEIYVKVLSMGGGLIRQTITDDDLRAIAHDFGVTLNENFLD